MTTVADIFKNLMLSVCVLNVCQSQKLPTLYEYYTSRKIETGLIDARRKLTLNNKNIQIFSGALHYFRIHPNSWRDRLRKLRAAGLNAVETYVPWNLHQPQINQFDFGNGGSDMQMFLNITRFLDIAKEEDLFVILRPGPYICAEFEFGGLPSWLLRNENITVRSSDPVFMKHVNIYFEKLFPIVVPYQFTKGGPIIAFQIENEYAGTTIYIKEPDTQYLNDLKNIFTNNGIVELLFTSDQAILGSSGTIDNVLATINFNSFPLVALTVLMLRQFSKPLMVTEFYSGWYDRWTETHNTKSVKSFTDDLENILWMKASVNIYMFAGGSTWGFYNGGNILGFYTGNKGYKPIINSYDYDAPIAENGDYKPKYHMVKKLLEKYNTIKTRLPDMPPLEKRVGYSSIQIDGEIRLYDYLNTYSNPIPSEKTIPMELLPINNGSGQSYGYIVYRKKGLYIPPRSKLVIEGRVCDTIMVLIDGVLKSKILSNRFDLHLFGYWNKNHSKLGLGMSKYENVTLDLIVENWGRNDYGTLNQFRQFKGLWQGNVLINDEIITGWSIIPLEFTTKWNNELSDWKNATFSNGPALYKATLNVTELKDTYVDLSEWTKGIIIINGFVLSRHCMLGPQQTIYLPGPLLKLGLNTIIIFEHFKPNKFINFSPCPTSYLQGTTNISDYFYAILGLFE